MAFLTPTSIKNNGGSISDTKASISGVAIDADGNNSAAMIFTIDRKRNYLYMSVHKDIDTANASSAQSFVSTCR